MNKKLLSLALASAFVSSGAQALVNLDADTGTLSVASELIVPVAAKGTPVVNAASGLSIDVKMGFSIAEGSSRFVRVSLANGTFAAVVSATMDDTTTAGAVVNASGGAATVSQGGGVDDNYIIVEVGPTGAGQTVTTTNLFHLVPGAAGINMLAAGGVTASYALYQDAVDAVNQTNALSTESGTVIAQKATLSVAANTFTATKIDVTKGSDLFTNLTVTAPIGLFKLATSATAGVLADGATAATTANITAATSKLVISGDFTAAQDLTAGAPDGTYTVGATSPVFIDNDADATDCNTKSVTATALTGTSATFTIGNAALAGAQSDGQVCMTVNGVSLIGQTTFTGQYQPVSASPTTIAVANVDVTMATLAKNGSTTEIDLMLTPGGAFSNYLRITNPSTIAGDVFVTLIADDGSSVQFGLSTVAGQTSGEVAAGASTGMIMVTDLYAAAQVADATFDVAGGKLRALVEGEFGSLASPIKAQSITLSRDNNTFSTF